MYCTYLTHILLRMDVLVALIDSSRGGEGRGGILFVTT